MTHWEISPELLVLLAGALYALGFLVINQKILRVLVLIGTLLYIWYYFIVADRPLWEAIAMATAVAAANLLGLTGLYLRASRFIVPKAHRDIHAFFPEVPPGDFRTLVKLSQRVRITEETVITREDARVDRMWFVVSGQLEIDKRGERFSMPAGVFVGEVAFLTGMTASATTVLPAGAEALVWDVEVLRQRARREPRFLMALEAMISRDLALKVALAVAPQSARDTSRASVLRDELKRLRGASPALPVR
jgi:CRP-like cAMP-binding protein